MLEPSVESWLPQLLNKAFFEAMSRREVGLRAALPRLPPLGTPEGLLLLEEARSVVSEAADVFELLLVTFVTCEVMLKHPLDVRRRRECIKMLSRLNPADVMAANASFITSMRAQPGSQPKTKAAPGPEIIRDLVSLAEAVIRGEAFESVQFFAWVDLPEVQARIGRARESMKQFIVRNDPWLDSRLAALGEKYAQGLLSVTEVAAVLQIGVPDAVVRLEECGYVRSIEAAALTDEKRAGLLDALRRDRLLRQGKPRSGQSGILRSVAATQRIEGIDARGWLELK